MNTFEKAMDWLARVPAAPVRRARGKRELLQDFAFLRHFSYGCKQVFSGERWALTRRVRACSSTRSIRPAATSSRSPTPTSCELVARDRAGRPIDAYARIYDQIFHSFYESTLALYRDQYPIFGDPEVLPVKVIWDYTYYWGVLCQFFFQRRLADLAALSALRDELAACQALNLAVQALLRDWSARSQRRNRPGDARPGGARGSPSSTRPARHARRRRFRARIRASTLQLRALAREIVANARADHADLDAGAVACAARRLAWRAAAGMLFDSAA